MDMSLKRWLRLELAAVVVIVLVLLVTYPNFGVVRAANYTDIDITNMARTNSAQPATNQNGANSQTIPYDCVGYSVSTSNRCYLTVPALSSGIYLNGTLYLRYRSGVADLMVNLTSTSSFDETTITWNNQPSGIDFISSTKNTVSNRTTIDGKNYFMIVLPDENGGDFYIGSSVNSVEFWDDEYDADLSFVRYYYSDSNSVAFIPDVNSTNTTSVTVQYYASSGATHFGDYSLEVKARDYNASTYYETWYANVPVLDSLTLLNLSVWLNTPFYINKKLEIIAYLNDSIGTLVSDTIIYDPSYSSPVVPNITDIPVPIWTPLVIPTIGIEPNESINGSWSGGWYNYSNNTMSQYNESISGILSFIQQPLRGMRGYVDTVNSTFSTGAFNTSKSILTAVCPCIIQTIHWKVKAVMSLYFSMVFVLILIGRM